MSGNDQTGSRELQPPCSMAAEQALLGGLMLDPEALLDLEGRLRPEDFYFQRHQLIFQAMLELARKDKPVDGVTLKEALAGSNGLDRVGGEAYLAELVGAVPTAKNIRHYAGIVRAKAMLRRLIQVCSEIIRRAYEDGDREIREHLDEAESRIFNLLNDFDASAGEHHQVGEVLTGLYKELLHRYENPGAMHGIPTGFKKLDEMTSGLQRGDLVIIAARPSMGKTALALNMAMHAALHAPDPGGVVIFSLEMPAKQLVMRLLASEALVDMSRMRSGRFLREDWQNMAHAVGRMAQTPVFIDDTPGLTVLNVRARCRRILRREKRLNLVVIDYLQLMRGPANSERREQEISAITRNLKILAKELDVPIIALSQLNRSIETRRGQKGAAGTAKRPLMSDLRESGAIEQDADVIMFIHREEVYTPDTPDAGMADLILAKQRNGPIGDIRLAYVKQYTKFSDLEHRDDF